MAESSPASPAAGSARSATEQALKKRKVRQGTNACWACKRRKVRCTFSESAEEEDRDPDVCDSCRRRNVTCVRQEFPEELSLPAAAPPAAAGGPAQRIVASNNDLVDRFGKVEALVERLSRRLDQQTRDKSPAPSGFDLASLVTGSSPQHLAQEIGVPTPADSGLGNDVRSPTTNREEPVADPLHRLFQEETSSRYDELYTSLAAGWPTPETLALILAEPMPRLGFFHGAVQFCTPYAKCLWQAMPAAEEILKFPPRGSHPIFMAKALLVLAAYLQSMPRAAFNDHDDDDAGDKGQGAAVLFEKTRRRAVQVANRLVTSDDDLVASVEGVECILMECIYHNNEGNLLRACMTNRRAMIVAQTLGMHRLARVATPTAGKKIKCVDSKSLQRLDPEYVWYKIVNTDHYLSLMLGLPLGSTDRSFADPHVLASRSPVERLERISSLAASRIIERNDAGVYDRKQTLEIDRIMQQGAANMPAQWWLPPGVDAPHAPTDREMLGENIRLMNQFAYFNVLVHLHLPYILRHPSGSGNSPEPHADHMYSKTTVVNVSREILSRFVTFRHSNEGAPFCRGIDFVAFTASTALCLVHIDAGRQFRGDDDAGGISGRNPLAHQRLNDRGILERTLAIMDQLSNGGADPILSRISKILRPLLAIEADVFAGESGYSDMSISTSTDDRGGFDNLEENDERVLKIPIPHFGIIKIEKGGISKMTFKYGEVTGGGRMQSNSVSGMPDSHGGVFDGRMPEPSGIFTFDGEQDHFSLHARMTPNNEDWGLQGVDVAFFENLMRGSLELDGNHLDI